MSSGLDIAGSLIWPAIAQPLNKEEKRNKDSPEGGENEYVEASGAREGCRQQVSVATFQTFKNHGNCLASGGNRLDAPNCQTQFPALSLSLSSSTSA